MTGNRIIDALIVIVCVILLVWLIIFLVGELDEEDAEAAALYVGHYLGIIEWSKKG